MLKLKIKMGMRLLLMRYFCIILILLASVNQAFTQLSFTASNDAQTIAGSNISVFNASLSGHSDQSVLFDYDGVDMETSSGVILSTGRAVDAIGPNTSPGTSTGFNGAGRRIN